MRPTTALFVGALITFGVMVAVIGMTEPQRNETVTNALVVSAKKGSRLVVVPSGSFGMFWVQARINDDITTRLLIDTGATFTSLSRADVQQLKRKLIHGPKFRSSTVNGFTHTFKVKFERVEVGHISLTDVEGQTTSDVDELGGILGMSFLLRLKRWEYQAGKLVLEQ